MNTVDAFGWAQVAGIAGAALVCLMALVGILLGLILKRQHTEPTGNGFINQMVEIKKTIYIKIDSEIKDRKEDFNTVKMMIQTSSKEHREDVNTLHLKLENEMKSVMRDFNLMCDKKQQLCGDKHMAVLSGTEDKLIFTCKRVDMIERERTRKWEGQEGVNRNLFSRIKTNEERG